jgi:2-keto-4-pentenoate hydratase/2-oxohepta-3-ene-1,7-dioic acid hydratase in catechol pathway
MTGTPKGVGPIEPGDHLVCQVDIIGKMEVEVR